MSGYKYDRAAPGQRKDAVKDWQEGQGGNRWQQEKAPAYDRGVTRTTLSRGMTPVYDRGTDISRPDKGARNPLHDRGADVPRPIRGGRNTLVDQQRQKQIERERERAQAQAYTAEANRLYEEYLNSEEYAEKKDKAHEPTTLRISPVMRLNAANKEADEYKNVMAYYKNQEEALEDRYLMEDDLEEYASWDEDAKKIVDDFLGGKALAILLKENPGVAQKYGEQRIREMAESLWRSRNQKLAEMVIQDGQALANDGFGGSVMGTGEAIGNSLLATVSAPLTWMEEGRISTGRYHTLDPNAGGRIYSQYSNAIINQVAENIESGNGFLGDLGAWAYRGGVGAAENLLKIALTGGSSVGTLGLMAVGSFDRTLSEASARGASPGEAVLTATASAGIEVLTEKIGLDELFKAGKSGVKSAKQFIASALKQGGVEATEEEIAFLGNLVVEAVILQEKSSYNQQIAELVANGMSYDDAKNQVNLGLWEEALDTAVTSMFSGSAMYGGTALMTGGQYAAGQKGADNTNPFAPMAKGNVNDPNSLAPMAKENAPQRTDSAPEAAPEADPAADFNRVAAEVAPREQAVQKPKEYSDAVIRAALDETVGAQASTPINNLHAENLVQPEKTFNERIQEVVSEMFPSDLDKAVNEYRSGKAVSDSVAESILGKTGFVQKLQQEVGVNLDGTRVEQIHAVKNAIARLANKQIVAPTTENTGRGTGASKETASIGWDPFAEYRLLNEEGIPLEAMGAASIGHSHSAAYNQLLSDDNVQAHRADDVRFVEVPKKDAQGRNVSEFAGNAVGSSSIAESFIPTIERLIASGQLSHDTRHTAEGLAKASARILDRGIDETFTKLSVEAAKGVTSADLEDEAFLLVNFFQEMPGENAQRKAAEAFVLLENFAHNSGGALVEIRNLFRRLDARTQLEAWQKEAAKLADAAKLKPEDVTISDKSQQEFLDVANAEETAVTDAAKTLNRSSKQDAEAAAGKAAKKVLDRADMTPQQIGNLAGERTAKSATTTSRQTPTADDLYDALMTFIRSKKNPVTPKRRRSNALAALQRYYQDKDSFEAAWQQARRRAEMELGNDERGYQILQQFLDTGGMAQDIMDAYDRRSVSRRAMKEAATATSTDFNQLIASSIQDKHAALAKIQTYISENYGVSGKQAAEMANQIQESFFQELSERQSRRLRSLFAERGQTAVADDNGILPAKFRQLYNLGAFDGDGFISRAALKRLFGADGLVLFREVLNEYGTTSELRKTAVEQKIVQEIADQLPTTLWDALNQWRYFAMLANPSTHGKNMIGTFGMTLIQHGLRDNLAAAMEIGTYYVSGKRTARTKSFLNPLSKKDWQLAASAWNDYQNDVVSRAIKNGGRYGNAKSRVEDAKRAWKFNSHKDNKLISAINSVLGVAESATNLNSKLMDAEDAIFGRTSYSLALAGYLKANRLDHITPEARDYAIKQAQTATFHDDSFLYQKVKGISNSKAVSMSAPFLKTPVNTTARVAEYSPGSLFAACYDFVRAAKHDGKTSADVINDLSTSIVGTALWGFGYWLAKEGLLRIGGSGSEEEREYEERMGFEPWTALIDGEYVDIRALSPVCVPIATGAAIYEAIQNFDDGITFQEAMEALYYIADPILSSSPASNLDGYMYAIRGMDTMTTGELAGTIAAELVESYAGQFIPTFLRRVVNAQDNTQRKSVFTGDPLQDSTQYIRSGLPGERENMYTEYDPWGSPLMQDATTADGLENWIAGVIGTDAMNKIGEKLGQDWVGTAARTLNVFPKSDAHTTDIDDEIKRLLRNGYAAYPTEARKYITIPGIDAEGNSQSEKVQLTTEQWDTYNKTRGEMSYQLAKQIMASPVYAAMGDEEKAALLQAAYNYADELGKQAAIPERYTANIGEHLAGLEGVQDITAALVNHEATDNIADAIDGLAALWSAGRDTSGAVAALEEAEAVFDALDEDVRKILTESSTGRLKAFLSAKDKGISAEKFSQVFTKYYELGKQYEDESEAATHWESSLKDMVNNRVITHVQANALKEGLKYWRQISADPLGKHTEYLAAGFSTDDALELTYAIDALAAEPGYADVRPIQRIETIANADYLTESQRIKAMQMYMEDGQIQKMNSIMDELNLTAAEYAEIYRAHLPQDKKDEEIAAYRALGYSQAEAERIYRIYNPTKKK